MNLFPLVAARSLNIMHKEGVFTKQTNHILHHTNEQQGLEINCLFSLWTV